MGGRPVTGDLILTTHFQEVPVRIIQREKDRMIPLVDIATALGHDIRVLRAQIDRNPALFEGLEGRLVIASPGGMQETRCLTRDGVLGLMMRLDTSRVKSEEIRSKIVAFQKWAVKVLGQVMDGRFDEVQVPANVQASVMLEDHLRMAKALTEYAGVKPGIAAAVAIAVVQERTGADLTWCRNLLPPAQDQPGYLIPSEIGLKIGLSARRVNELLAELGYQVKSKDGWKLNGPGRFYGEEYPFSRNGHSGYQIRWKPEVVMKVKDRLRAFDQFNQGGLITGYLS
jgi:hypothetical protein